MQQLAIVIPKGAVMPTAVMDAYFLLSQANQFLEQTGKEPAFAIEILGYQKKSALYEGLFTVQTNHFQSCQKVFDLILLPGFTSEMDEPLELNKPLIDWLKEQHLQHGTELASMCTGAFLLAATGLLDDKKCTAHWAFEASFRQKFPQVHFMPEYITTDENGLYTSGGAYSSLNLILYLIEKFCGRETAVWTAKMFQLDIDRRSQRPFVIFNRQKSHNDEQVRQVQVYIEANFSDPLSVNELASKFSFSYRNFIRRFKEATGNTPLEYIQRIRVEAAKRLLEQSTKSIGEIMYESGYSDSRSFRDLFRKHTGFLPSQYRNRYR